MGEQLRVKHENNENERRAVAVLKDSIVVGHLPRESAKTVGVFEAWGVLEDVK